MSAHFGQSSEAKYPVDRCGSSGHCLCADLGHCVGLHSDASHPQRLWSHVITSSYITSPILAYHLKLLETVQVFWKLYKCQLFSPLLCKLTVLIFFENEISMTSTLLWLILSSLSVWLTDLYFRQLVLNLDLYCSDIPLGYKTTIIYYWYDIILYIYRTLVSK